RKRIFRSPSVSSNAVNCSGSEFLITSLSQGAAWSRSARASCCSSAPVERQARMSGTLVVHRGGWAATKADLAAVPVPDPTDSYHPVPSGRFIEEVELHVPRFGLTVQSSAFALAREGGQMFGVLTCANGKPDHDYALAIGVRNSYDRSLS